MKGHAVRSKGLFGKKSLRIEEREQEIAVRGDDQVLVRIRACGVCEKDVAILQDWHEDPLPLGHEIAGEVVDVGRDVANVKPGDSVVVEDCAACSICDDCRNGEPEFCRDLYTLEDQPGLGQYLAVRYNLVCRFEDMSFDLACLAEPVALALTSVEAAAIPMGGSVAVIGSGPLALLVARLAKLRGAGFVALAGSSASRPMDKARTEAANVMGCDMVIEPGRQSLEDVIKQRFSRGVDRVIVSAGPEMLCEAVKIARHGGVIAFSGLHFGGKSMVSLDMNELIYHKLTLKPVFAEPASHFPIALNLLRNGVITAAGLITHRFGFAQAQDMFRTLAEGAQPVVKAIMIPND